MNLRIGIWTGAVVGLVGIMVCTADNAPTLLNFQGRLTNAGGAPVTAPTAVRFTMYQGGSATENPSTGTMVYQEDATVTPDGNGVFSTVIGRGTPVGGQTLTPSDFNTNGLPLYIEMSIGGSVLLPRTQVISAGFAVESSRLGGLSAQDIIGQSGGNAFANAVVRNGAGIAWVSASQISIKPGTLGFPDGRVRRTTTTLTWNSANPTGPLGLDTGTNAANTWYYLYAIPDPNDDTKFTAVASTRSPTQVGGLGPAGYSVNRFIGSFKNDSTPSIMRFFRLGPEVIWHAHFWWLYVCAGPQPAVNSWVAIDASPYEPVTANGVMTDGYYDAFGNAAFKFYLSAGGTDSPGGQDFCVDWQQGASTCRATVPTVGGVFSYYAELQGGGWTNDANQCTAFSYTGYIEDLRDF